MVSNPYIRIARPAAVLAAALAMTVVYVAPASAATTTKIKTQITNRTLIVTGSEGSDNIAVHLRAGDPNTVEVVDMTRAVVQGVNRNDFENIRVEALGGNDTVSADDSGGIFTDTEATTLDGGNGNDTLTGASGGERLLGGPGNDVVRGGRGNDIALLDEGNDTFVWNPGDANDTVEGQNGVDRMLFNGANVNEKIDVSANGGRVRFTRDVANITMDLNGIENVDFNAFGGTDVVTVNDLSGTDTTAVNTDLAAIPGTTTGDAAADNVVVNGTSAADTFAITGGNGAADVTGGAARVHVVGGETANDILHVNGLAGADQITADPAAGTAIGVVVDGGADADTVTTNGTNHADTFFVVPNGTLVAVTDNAGGIYSAAAERVTVNGLGGNDTITAANGLATLTQLAIDGGNGKDNLTGGDGADIIVGGTGSDQVNGGRGNDVAFLGTGRDTFVWNPGDGSDTVEGQDGHDTMLFNGANINEKIDVSANGGRARFTRDVANITMDLNDVETIAFNALGGTDTVTVNDLTGTDVTNVALDLGNPPGTGTGDGAADNVILNGTNGDDHVRVSNPDGPIKVRGLVPRLTITGAEAANDRLDINTLLGVDKVTSHLPPGVIALFVNGSPA